MEEEDSFFLRSTILKTDEIQNQPENKIKEKVYL